MVNTVPSRCWARRWPATADNRVSMHSSQTIHEYSRIGGLVRIVIGSDHAGFELKQSLAAILPGLGYDVLDVGTRSTAPVDYPDFAEAVAHAVKDGSAD